MCTTVNSSWGSQLNRILAGTQLDAARRALKGDTKVACLLGVGGLEQLASARARGLLKCSNALLQVVVGRQHHCQGDVSGSRRLQQAPTGSCRGLTTGRHATA